MSGNNTIVILINRRNYRKTLEKNKDSNNKLSQAKLGLQLDGKILLSKDLTPYNQYLAWTCREKKRVKRIHSCWSSKGAVKIRRTMNERAINIKHKFDIKTLYPGFEKEVEVNLT